MANGNEKVFGITPLIRVKIESFEIKNPQRPFQLLIELKGKDFDDTELSYTERIEYPSIGNRDEKYNYFLQAEAQKFAKKALMAIKS